MVVHRSAILAGSCLLGRGTSVGEGCTVSFSCLGEGCKVGKDQGSAAVLSSVRWGSDGDDISA